MSEVARIVLANQLAIIRFHEVALRANADKTAVHETRKAIRRMRTAFRVFGPYYKKRTFKPFRRCLKQTMQRLAHARDLAVFIDKLEAYVAARAAEEQTILLAMAPYCEEQLREANAQAQAAVEAPAYQACLARFTAFLRHPVGVRLDAGAIPQQVRHLAAVHIYRRLAAVRAYDDLIVGAKPETLHQLRVQFKELRYTLEFFVPVLDDGVGDLVTHLDAIQDHLGDLNDAHVALHLLAGTSGWEDAVDLYRAEQEHKIRNLVDSFTEVWNNFNSVVWRRHLADAVATL
jgi:CHAD domain-containing protein